jgi:hypothetical protein
VTDLFIALVVGLLEALVTSAGSTLHQALGSWLLSTNDMSQLAPRPITTNPNLRALHHLILLMSDSLLVLTLLWASGRSMWERSFRAKYTLKVVVPRILSAIVLAHFSLLLGQMVIDLNNAMVATVWNYHLPRGSTGFPWEAMILRPGVFQAANLFTVLLCGALLIAVCILALSYVIRFTVLAVLLVLAPLAALCLVLPETHTYARAWTRLFTTTVFTQFVQIVVLKLAAALMLDQHGSLIQAIYGLATVYVLLKIPGALHSSSQLGTRALRMASHAEHSLEKMVMHQLGPTKTAA